MKKPPTQPGRTIDTYKYWLVTVVVLYPPTPQIGLQQINPENTNPPMLNHPSNHNPPSNYCWSATGTMASAPPPTNEPATYQPRRALEPEGKLAATAATIPFSQNNGQNHSLLPIHLHTNAKTRPRVLPDTDRQTQRIDQFRPTRVE